MLCCRISRFVFKVPIVLALVAPLVGCDTLHGFSYDLYDVNRDGWPTPYRSATDDALRGNCASFATKMLPLISRGDNEATYLMSQAMRRGLHFGKTKIEFNKSVIDERQANLDLLVFYAALPEYDARFVMFKESRRERYGLIDELLVALRDTVPVEDSRICYRASRSPQQCYQSMVDQKIIPPLSQRVADLQGSIQAGDTSAKCLTSYNKIEIPY